MIIPSHGLWISLGLIFDAWRQDDGTWAEVMQQIFAKIC
jgi:hypothetical protein